MKKQIDQLKPHELNTIFGNLPQTEFEALKDDISKRGIQSIIDITEDNVIVCGHQRVRACKELNIQEIDVKVLTGWSEDQVREHLIKDNVLRRQLTPPQIVKCGLELEKIYEGRHGGNKDTLTGKFKPSATNVAHGKNTDIVAKNLGVSGRTYERYKKAEILSKKLDKHELQQKWDDGKIKAGVIIKEHKKQEQKKQIEKETIPQPAGLFDVIVIDPPWNYTSMHDASVHDKRGLTDYNQIPTEELKKIVLPTKKDCILWLWTTNAFMKDAYQLIETWEFKDKTILTWDKQILGTGYWLRNITEHCILAIKGVPYFNNKKWTTLISEKRTGHSVKPELFYKMVEEICAGRKLDYFAREKRNGWESYGLEIKK